MRIAVLSDIHGNLEAFEAVLEDIGKAAPDRIISLGDNVGYGVDAAAVMALLETHGILSVLGNHEFALVHEPFINWFNPSARQAVAYTKENLPAPYVDTIKTYKKSMVMDGIRFVHGAPMNAVTVYLFQLSDKKLSSILNGMDESICFAGHTHQLELIEFDGERLERMTLSEGHRVLDRNRKYVVNAGSVGQPRDRDKRAKYLIFDTETYGVDVRCIDYDAEKAAQKILAAGLPATYAERLT